jgi:tropomyosin-1
MEPLLSSTTRRRGHQHHPRHATRRRLNQSVLSTNSSLTAFSTISSTPNSGPAQCGPAGISNDAILIKDSIKSSAERSKLQSNIRLNSNLISSRQKLGITRHLDQFKNESKLSCDNVIHNEKPMQSSTGDTLQNIVKPNLNRKNISDEILGKNLELKHADARAQGDGNSDEEIIIVEEDPEISELAKLRCTSERTEIQAEREAKRRKHCADYPGLAFGRSIFSSDTMMKFRLIKNELQNIMSTQLKRVSIMT